jgi:hypothetical protein
MIQPRNEWALDDALQWKSEMSARRLPAFTKPEPQWDSGDYDAWEDYVEAWYNWGLQRQFHDRGIIFEDAGDRDKWDSEVGYIKKIHQLCGLAVVLSIPEIEFRGESFGNARDYRNEDYTHNIFTEIRTDPDQKFLGLVLSDEYRTDNHYHITLTNTYDVGHGYNYNKKKIQEWKRRYNIIRERYNGRRARLGLGRWGGGYSSYVSDDTVVEGLERPYNIFSDPDVRFVFRVPGKYRANDDMHVSLLI